LAVGALHEIAIEQVDEPTCLEFLDYWHKKRIGLEPPTRRSFDPLIEKPHLAPQLMIFEPEGEYDFRLRLMGTQVVAQFGGDVTGHLLSVGWFADEVNAASGLFRKSAQTREPVAAEGVYHWQRREFVNWQCVIAPLRLDGATVEQFFCCLCQARWRKLFA
jgi:hypothetical protein